MASEPSRTSIEPIPLGKAAHLNGVNKWFRDFHVLCDIDLDIGMGERVVLWGPSGSGKTTLLRCLAGLEPVQSGTLQIAGVDMDVGPLARPKPINTVGMVFQRSALFLNLRVIDNLTIGLRSVLRMPKQAAITVAMENLAKVQMSHYADRYPGQLSGGQQQRVEIARALCMDPRIMLFDEPTAALDPELKREVGDVIMGLARDGRTIIVATHELELVRALSPRTLLMAEGRIVAESTTMHFLEDD